jgi:hypothetical protein
MGFNLWTIVTIRISEMAIAKKGTRLITVDDIEYRWVIQPDDEPGLGIVVECAENPGQRMITWVEHGNIISP